LVYAEVFILPFLDETVKEGLITLEKIRGIKYRNSDGKPI